MSFLSIGFPGGSEFWIIGFVVILIFGARKLPQLARSMGSSITQFKKGLKEDPDLLDESSDPDQEFIRMP